MSLPMPCQCSALSAQINTGRAVTSIHYISATDPNGDNLVYSASNLPNGATFNTQTQTFSWTPAPGQERTYANVRFEVSDGKLTSSETTAIAVNKNDVTPLEIRNVNSSDNGSTGIAIRWTTDETSTSQVEYWAGPHEHTPVDETLVTEHIVWLADLTPGVVYRYRTISVDKAGNTAVSLERTFTTSSSFAVSGLTISPSEVNTGDQVTISALVTNKGDSDGSYELVLGINSQQESVKTVQLPAGAQQRVSFVAGRDTVGVFTVDVNGITSVLLVSDTTKVVNWATLGMIIGGALLASMVSSAVLLYRRRSMLKGIIDK